MNMTFKSLIVSLVVFSSFTATAAVPTEKQESTSSLSKIIDAASQSYLQSLVAQEVAEKQEAERIAVENKKAFNPFNPLDKTGIKDSFGSIEQLKIAYNIHRMSGFALNDNCATTSNTLLPDLSLFKGDKDTPDFHVFSRIDKTRTLSGKVSLQALLSEPVTDTKTLQERQKFVQALMADEKFYAQMCLSLEKIKACEKDFLFLFRELTNEVEGYFKEVLFDWAPLRGLNQKPGVMQAGTHWLAARELAMFVTMNTLTTLCFSGYYMIKKNQTFTDAMLSSLKQLNGYSAVQNMSSGNFGFWDGYFIAMAALRIYEVTSAVRALNKRLPILNRLTELMTHAATVLTQTHGELVETLAQNQAARVLFQDLDKQSLERLRQDTKHDVLNVLKPIPESFFQAGGSATSFVRRDEIKNNFHDSYRLFGVVDAYVSIADLIKNSAQKSVSYCFVEYSDTTELQLDEFWHPMLNPETVVINSITLGCSEPLNSTITGPNAGGKTTSLRAIALAVLMGQTFGIAPAKYARFKPFHNIATYLNIPDSEGKESLFQAEMNRCKALLNAIKALDPATQSSIVFMDEIFTGTNIKEGIPAAFGVSKKLGSLPNSCALITTHFPELTQLEKETDTFRNRKVSVTYNEDGKLQFPYKLELGVTDQAIALDLMQEGDFDQEILDTAREFMNRPKVLAA